MSDTHPFFGYELPVPLVCMTGGGPETFDSISAAHVSELVKYLGLHSQSRVLEIGCGIGRDAIPLTQVITEGRYDGIDIIGESIGWLSANVTPDHPHFRFHHFDIADQLHNPTGTEDQKNHPIPLADDSVDSIFLWSVFTHMLADNVAFYLSEFRRVLRPGGQVYATCFAYDDAVLERARATNLTPYNLRFEHPWGDRCVIDNPDYPLGSVAYTQCRLAELVTASGLVLDRIALGSWSGYWPEPEGGQDALLMRKAA